MLKMREVIGVSKEGFSQAVASAVSQVAASGEIAHFIEVVEMRGSVRNGLLAEYQVKVKIALEDMLQVPASEHAHGACPTCNEKTGHAGHLCVPNTEKDHHCDWCGALIPDERHLCDDKLRELAYICNTCGRTAVSAEHLCSPQKISGKK